LSDWREALRRHFEVDAPRIVVAGLRALAVRGDIKADSVENAIVRYGLDADVVDPGTF